MEKGDLRGCEQDVERQAVLGEPRRELQAHGLGLDAHGLLGIAPVKVIFLADGPKKPGQKSGRDLHPVPGVVEMVEKHLGHHRQGGGQFGPVRILDDLFEGDLGMDLGDAGLVLSGPEKSHLQPAGFGMEPEDEVMAAGFGLGLGGKVGAKGLAPFAAHRCRSLVTRLGLVQGADALQGRGTDVAADPEKESRQLQKKLTPPSLRLTESSEA
jgi:hypothetical protein